MRSFERWSALGGGMEQSLIRSAIVLTSIPLENGFRLERKAFDSIDPPAYALNLERHLPSGKTDFIYIGFDKYYRKRFQILFGTKETNPPHEWVRAGALVWKSMGELQRYKWWGAKWWQINKVDAFEYNVKKALDKIPQVLEYLDSGIAGPHVLEER
ncbi:hypothetical protein [Luteimonas abyssi]|uniref:hypothetical protein n=1 Tax=Luteimonas abyssi TaxID=1247514 RepID=UPI0012F88148|nr:hypothetical protein [Luteimonas abyssi]